jgi:hypothetical protein
MSLRAQRNNLILACHCERSEAIHCGQARLQAVKSPDCFSRTERSFAMTSRLGVIASAAKQSVAGRLVYMLVEAQIASVGLAGERHQTSLAMT